MVEFILLLIAVICLTIAVLAVGVWRIHLGYLAAALVVTALWLIPAGQAL